MSDMLKDLLVELQSHEGCPESAECSLLGPMFVAVREELVRHQPRHRQFTKNTSGTVCNACSGRHWPCGVVERFHAVLVTGAGRRTVAR